MNFLKDHPNNNNLSKKRNYIFLFFTVLTFLFWMLNKLSKQYTQEVVYTLSYKSLPNQFIFQETPPQNISCNITSNGFYFFRLAFDQPNLVLDLQSVTKKSTYRYYLLKQALDHQFKSKLNGKVTYLGTAIDTLFLQLGKKKFKKVPVKPNIDIQYQSGYKSFSGVQIYPDTIEISGPEKQVSKLNQITLKKFVKKNVQTSVNESILIKKFNEAKITYSHEQVQLKVVVEKITEKTLWVPVKIINVLNKEVVVYPKRVKISCQVRLSDFNQVNPSDFVVVCDYQQRTAKHIKIKLMEKPNIVSSVKINTDKVEYLILK